MWLELQKLCCLLPNQDKRESLNMFIVDFSDNLTSLLLCSVFLGGLTSKWNYSIEKKNWKFLDNFGRFDLTEAISKSKDKLIYHQQMCFFISEEGKKDAIGNSIVKKSILIKTFRCHQLSTQQNIKHTRRAKIQNRKICLALKLKLYVKMVFINW